MLTIYNLVFITILNITKQSRNTSGTFAPQKKKKCVVGGSVLMEDKTLYDIIYNKKHAKVSFTLSMESDQLIRSNVRERFYRRSNTRLRSFLIRTKQRFGLPGVRGPIN